MNVITERDEAAQLFRDMAEKLRKFPALACSCRTLAGSVQEYNEVELGRKIAEHGRSRISAIRAARRLRKDVDVLDVKVDPLATLRIDDESGMMTLAFEDADAARALAFAYGLEIDDMLVHVGPCDSADLPIPYRRLHDEWVRLADAWEDEQAEAFQARVREERFERSSRGPL